MPHLAKKHLAFTAAAICAFCANAQSAIYPQHFDLHEITISHGPLRDAMDTNIDLLLQYDVDRLLTPFVRQAGLNSGPYANWETLHPNFENWGSGNFRLDGHVGGHYLSALALAYAASHDDAQRQALKQRLDYMVDVLKDCQDAFDSNTDGMRGFIGGQPVNEIWPALYHGDVGPFNNRGSWVTLYCEHKVMAGLRDAFVYAGNEKAKDCFIELCDWAVDLVSNISDSQLQSLLGWEHGGINETIADAYAITGDEKYLAAAKRYSHASMVAGMQGSEADYSQSFLDGKHANTQVPKYIGFERIHQLEPTADYHTAATNFWHDVACHRTVCIGGNSVSEHFLPKANSEQYITNLDGPESCNSNNMLKLSEMLFDQTHDSRYADFYESTMLNHILSTQDPATGGYVYFTSLRPQSYRIYSQVNQAMWCCVGTGMENHSKYGHFAYTHDGDNTLYVNLFIPSSLDNETFALTQETAFPFEPKTRITIDKPGSYTLAIRRPDWAGNGFSVTVNGSKADASTSGYVAITRDWKAGDVVDVSLPMSLRLEECPNLSRYVAIKYGPVLLAAATSPEGEALDHEYAHEERMGHAPANYATSKPLSSSPLLIGDRADVLPRITPIDASSLTFEMPVRWHQADSTVVLSPFYGIHHSRYSCYFWQGTEDDYAASDMGRRDAEEQALLQRTVDFVATGEQQSEAGHEALYGATSSAGQYNNETYRDAKPGDFIQYTLFTQGQTDALAIMCRFTTADAGRKCRILIDGEQLANVEIPRQAANADEMGFYNVEFPIPAALLQGKDAIVVRFEANQGTMMPGLYYLRLVNGWTDRLLYAYKCTDWVSGDPARVPQAKIAYDKEANTISVDASGANNVCLKLDTATGYEILSSQKYLVVVGSNLSQDAGASYLWWLNGMNHGTQVPPTVTGSVCLPDGSEAQLVAWDMTTSGIAENNKGDRFSITKGQTIFGLTAAKTPAVIVNIGFYESPEQASARSVMPDPSTESPAFDILGRPVSPTHHGLRISSGRKSI